MALHKPLVRVGGQIKQLPSGDGLTGVPVALPFWLSAGTRQDIPITAQGELPFWLSNGTPENIQVVYYG